MRGFDTLNSAAFSLQAVFSSLSHKTGVTYCNYKALTGSFTAVEDATKMNLPTGSQGAQLSVSPKTWNNFMPFIKVQ